MLKKPYQEFYEVDNNRYYLLQVNQLYYMAVESFLKYKQPKLFSKVRELQQSINLLPIYSPLLLAMTKLAQVKATGKQTVEGLGEEVKDEMINVDAVKKEIAKLTNSEHEESQFDFRKNIKSKVVKQMMEESELDLLMIERIDSIRSSYWLVKSDKFGKMTVHEVITSGRTEHSVQKINTFFLNKELIERLLIRYQKLQIEDSKRMLAAQKKELKRLVKKSKKLKNQGEIMEETE